MKDNYLQHLKSDSINESILLDMLSRNREGLAGVVVVADHAAK